MPPGMSVTVTEHMQTHPRAINGHQPAEGYGDPVAEHEFTDAVNIEQYYPIVDDPFRNEVFPKIVVEDEDGVHRFSSAVVDTGDADPEVTVTMVKDTTPSDVFNRTITYNAYGFMQEQIENKFGDTVDAYSIYLRNLDGEDVVFHPNKYRGFIVSYPDGETKHYGDLDRHSKTAQHRFEDTPPADVPYETGSGEMQVTADGNTYNGVVNVTRPEPGEYVLHTSIGNQIRVEEITDVDGALYTVGVRHNSPFGNGIAVSTAQRAVGVYVSAEHNIGSDDPALFAVGHPDSAGVYKTPYLHRVSKVSDIETMFVKRPDGTVVNNIENVLSVDERR